MATLSFSPAGTDAAADVVVLEEDQKKINRFARLNLRGEDFDDRLKDLKRQLENVEEASNELMLADDDDDDGLGDDDDDLDDKSSKVKSLGNVHYRFGDAFLAVGKDEAEVMLERERARLEEKSREIEAILAPLKEEMASIKATLYAKFGNNINLDNDED